MLHCVQHDKYIFIITLLYRHAKQSRNIYFNYLYVILSVSEESILIFFIVFFIGMDTSLRSV